MGVRVKSQAKNDLPLRQSLIFKNKLGALGETRTRDQRIKSGKLWFLLL
jgi:hypothetical protein